MDEARDVVTPQCVVCDTPVDLQQHLKKLNANQAFIGWQRENMEGEGIGSSPVVICDECKADPARVEHHLSRKSPEEIVAVLMRGPLTMQRIKEEEGGDA